MTTVATNVLTTYQSVRKWHGELPRLCVTTKTTFSKGPALNSPYKNVFFTKEVVENSFTQCSVHLHKVCEAVEILSARDPVWQLRILRCLARIVESQERILEKIYRLYINLIMTHIQFMYSQFKYTLTCTVWPTIRSVHPTWWGPFPGGILILLWQLELPIAKTTNQLNFGINLKPEKQEPCHKFSCHSMKWHT